MDIVCHCLGCLRCGAARVGHLERWNSPLSVKLHVHSHPFLWCALAAELQDEGGALGVFGCALPAPRINRQGELRRVVRRGRDLRVGAHLRAAECRRAPRTTPVDLAWLHPRQPRRRRRAAGRLRGAGHGTRALARLHPKLLHARWHLHRAHRAARTLAWLPRGQLCAGQHHRLHRLCLHRKCLREHDDRGGLHREHPGLCEGGTAGQGRRWHVSGHRRRCTTCSNWRCPGSLAACL
mmetsp:Transcript_81612/g.257387  ORF Transcript_81612/g.257387 Transcript_81612/m.257387 type:complete len:237 (+) Transcript_81612:388-1098(+)